MLRDSKRLRKAAQVLLRAGATVVWAPVIALIPAADSAPLDRALANLSRFDWVVFTSRTAVEMVLDRRGGRYRPSFAGVRFAAVGNATAQALGERNLSVALVAQTASSASQEGILEAFSEFPISGQSLWLPSGDKNRPDLAEGLRARGAEVTVTVVYQNRPQPLEPAVRAEVSAGRIDAVCYTAASTVHALVEQLSPAEFERLKRARHICIGPETARALAARGLSESARAPEPSLASLMETTVSDLCTREGESHVPD